MYFIQDNQQVFSLHVVLQELLLRYSSQLYLCSDISFNICQYELEMNNLIYMQIN